MNKTPPSRLARTAHNTSLIPLYVRLASVFRDAIATGKWVPGQRLPTIPELCEQYNVARITMRQALALLINDELISSTAGRGTFVNTGKAIGVREASLRAAINDPLQLAADETIEVLQRGPVAALPAQLAAGDAQYPGYMRLLKLHRHRGEPFQIVDTYVAASVYKRFPRGSDVKAKTARLLRDHGSVLIRSTRQELTIAYADTEIAGALQCPIASVLVRIRRWRMDHDGLIVYAAMNHYRGDLFVLDMETRAADESFTVGIVPAEMRAD